MFLLLVRCAPGQYAGSQTCRACHPRQAASHSKTAHAGALSRAEEHPLRSAWGKAQGEWAFGAGDQAVTFVSRLDEDYYIEHGLTWYSASKAFGITPGHRNATGERYRTFDPDAAMLRCFQCHATGPLKLGAGFRIEPSEPGVQCEACHGPGEAHARFQRPIVNPRKLTASKVNSLCGACHRMPAAAGDDTDWTNPWNVRHQPLYLNESACFQQSRGKLSCLTCHAAHQPVSHDSAAYDRICADCHPQPRHRSVVRGNACVSCHMPEVRPHPDLEFANHWIGVYAPKQTLKPMSRR